MATNEKNKYKKIPSSFQVGGTKINVQHVERCDDNAAGLSLLIGGYIQIADLCNKDSVQSEDSKRNTFFHELCHCILDTMGEGELSRNETFVSSFAGFLTEAMHNAEFKE